MDTFTIALLSWVLYLAISYFEKRGKRGKAILSTMLISFVIVLRNTFGNFSNISQLGLPKLIMTVGASVLILSFFIFLPVLFKQKNKTREKIRE